MEKKRKVSSEFVVTLSNIWSVTHCDLAKSCQPHGECGGHEVFEGEVQALLVEAQRAVQWFLHRAPHQVSHVARRALPQLLVRELTQIPAGSKLSAHNTFSKIHVQRT